MADDKLELGAIDESTPIAGLKHLIAEVLSLTKEAIGQINNTDTPAAKATIGKVADVVQSAAPAVKALDGYKDAEASAKRLTQTLESLITAQRDVASKQGEVNRSMLSFEAGGSEPATQAFLKRELAAHKGYVKELNATFKNQRKNLANQPKLLDYQEKASGQIRAETQALTQANKGLEAEQNRALAAQSSLNARQAQNNAAAARAQDANLREAQRRAAAVQLAGQSTLFLPVAQQALNERGIVSIPPKPAALGNATREAGTNGRDSALERSNLDGFKERTEAAHRYLLEIQEIAKVLNVQLPEAFPKHLQALDTGNAAAKKKAGRFIADELTFPKEGLTGSRQSVAAQLQAPAPVITIRQQSANLPQAEKIAAALKELEYLTQAERELDAAPKHGEKYKKTAQHYSLQRDFAQSALHDLTGSPKLGEEILHLDSSARKLAFETALRNTAEPEQTKSAAAIKAIEGAKAKEASKSIVPGPVIPTPPGLANSPIVLLACSGTKSKEAGEISALERYTGPSVKAGVAAARASGVPDENIYFFSALHGIIPGLQKIADYSQQIGKPGAIPKDELAKQISALGDRPIAGVLPAAYAKAFKAAGGELVGNAHDGGHGRNVAVTTQKLGEILAPVKAEVSPAATQKVKADIEALAPKVVVQAELSLEPANIEKVKAAAAEVKVPVQAELQLSSSPKDPSILSLPAPSKPAKSGIENGLKGFQDQGLLALKAKFDEIAKLANQGLFNVANGQIASFKTREEQGVRRKVGTIKEPVDDLAGVLEKTQRAVPALKPVEELRVGYNRLAQAVVEFNAAVDGKGVATPALNQIQKEFKALESGAESASRSVAKLLKDRQDLQELEGLKAVQGGTLATNKFGHGYIENLNPSAAPVFDFAQKIPDTTKGDVERELVVRKALAGHVANEQAAAESAKKTEEDRNRILQERLAIVKFLGTEPVRLKTAALINEDQRKANDVLYVPPVPRYRPRSGEAFPPFQIPTGDQVKADGQTGKTRFKEIKTDIVAYAAALDAVAVAAGRADAAIGSLAGKDVNDLRKAVEKIQEAARLLGIGEQGFVGSKAGLDAQGALAADAAARAREAAKARNKEIEDTYVVGESVNKNRSNRAEEVSPDPAAASAALGATLRRGFEAAKDVGHEVIENHPTVRTNGTVFSQDDRNAAHQALDGYAQRRFEAGNEIAVAPGATPELEAAIRVFNQRYNEFFATHANAINAEAEALRAASRPERLAPLASGGGSGSGLPPREPPGFGSAGFGSDGNAFGGGPPFRRPYGPGQQFPDEDPHFTSRRQTRDENHDRLAGAEEEAYKRNQKVLFDNEVARQTYEHSRTNRTPEGVFGVEGDIGNIVQGRVDRARNEAIANLAYEEGHKAATVPGFGRDGLGRDFSLTEVDAEANAAARKRNRNREVMEEKVLAADEEYVNATIEAAHARKKRDLATSIGALEIAAGERGPDSTRELAAKQEILNQRELTDRKLRVEQGLDGSRARDVRDVLQGYAPAAGGDVEKEARLRFERERALVAENLLNQEKKNDGSVESTELREATARLAAERSRSATAEARAVLGLKTQDDYAAETGLKAAKLRDVALANQSLVQSQEYLDAQTEATVSQRALAAAKQNEISRFNATPEGQALVTNEASSGAGKRRDSEILKVRQLEEELSIGQRTIEEQTQIAEILAYRKILEKEAAARVVAASRNIITEEVQAGRLDGGTAFQRFQASIKGNKNAAGTEQELGAFFKQKLSTTVGFAASGALTYGIFNQLKVSLEQAEKLEVQFAILGDQMNALGRGGNLEATKEAILGISEATGIAAAEITKAQLVFNGLFDSSAAAVAATENAAKLSVSTGAPLRDITDATSSVKTNFGEQAAAKLDDITIGIENKTGISAAEQLKFLGSVAPVAQQAGFSLEKIASIGAAAAQASGKSISTIGEGLNRVIPALETQSLKVIEIVGKIPALAGEYDNLVKAYGRGDLAAVFDIVAANFDKMSKAQQDSIAPILGGRREANILIGVWKNWNAVAGINEAALNSQGAAQRRFELVSKSLKVQMDKLKASFTEFAAELLSSGLGDAIGQIFSTFGVGIKAVSPLIALLAKLATAFGGLPLKIYAGATALKILSATMVGLSGGGGGLLGGLGSILGISTLAGSLRSRGGPGILPSIGARFGTLQTGGGSATSYAGSRLFAPATGAAFAPATGLARFLPAAAGIGAAALINSQFKPSKGRQFASDIAVGAGIGGSVGSVVPGVGTAIGAGVGAAIGAGVALFSNKDKNLTRDESFSEGIRKEKKAKEEEASKSRIANLLATKKPEDAKKAQTELDRLKTGEREAKAKSDAARQAARDEYASSTSTAQSVIDKQAEAKVAEDRYKDAGGLVKAGEKQIKVSKSKIQSTAVGDVFANKTNLEQQALFDKLKESKTKTGEYLRSHAKIDLAGYKASLADTAKDGGKNDDELKRIASAYGDIQTLDPGGFAKGEGLRAVSDAKQKTLGDIVAKNKDGFEDLKPLLDSGEIGLGEYVSRTKAQVEALKKIKALSDPASQQAKDLVKNIAIFDKNTAKAVEEFVTKKQSFLSDLRNLDGEDHLEEDLAGQIDILKSAKLPETRAAANNSIIDILKKQLQKKIDLAPDTKSKNKIAKEGIAIPEVARAELATETALATDENLQGQINKTTEATGTEESVIREAIGKAVLAGNGTTSALVKILKAKLFANNKRRLVLLGVVTKEDRGSQAYKDALSELSSLADSDIAIGDIVSGAEGAENEKLDSEFLKASGVSRATLDAFLSSAVGVAAASHREALKAFVNYLRGRLIEERDQMIIAGQIFEASLNGGDVAGGVAALNGQIDALDKALKGLSSGPKLPGRVRNPAAASGGGGGGKSAEDIAKEIADAKIDLFEALTGPSVIRSAQAAQQKANSAAQYAKTEADRIKAQVEQIKADRQYRDALITVGNSTRDVAIALANVHGDGVRAAYLAMRQASSRLAAAVREGSGVEVINAAKVEVINAQAALAAATLARTDSYIEVANAIAGAAGDSVGQAQNALRQAAAKLRAAKSKHNGVESINAANAEVISAQANLRDAQLAERTATIQFNLDAGRISKSQALAQYESILSSADILKLNEHQKRDLILDIKRLKDDLSSNLGFNIPSEIRLPTLYEVRRADQSGGTSHLNDNRTTNIEINVNSTNATPAEIRQAVTAGVNQSNGAPSTTQSYGARTGVGNRLY